MNASAPQGRSLRVPVAGVAFFSVAMPIIWTVLTLAATSFARNHRQSEAIGYMMFVYAPLAGLGGAIAGFLVSYFGDPARWLRRWAITAVVGTLLGVATNALVVMTS